MNYLRSLGLVAFTSFVATAICISGIALAESASATDEIDTSSQSVDAQGPDAEYEAPNYSLERQGHSIRDQKSVTYGSPTSFLEWHGYLDFEFDDGQGANSNFDNHEFYLSTKANISERLRVIAEFEYEHTPEKLILPVQAFAEYDLWGDMVTIRAGLFYVPLGINRSLTLRAPENHMVRQVAFTHDLIFENWSTVGVEIYGELPIGDTGLAWFYDLSIGNGIRGYGNGDSWFDADETLQNHTEDNNNNKLFAGRTGISFSNILGFGGDIGFSYATQQYNTGSPKGNNPLNHFGTDLRISHESGFGLQAEYMEREGEDNTLDSSSVTADAEGWYVKVYQRMFEQHSRFVNFVDLVFQIDSIDTNDMVGNSLLTLAPAIVYSPEAHLQLKLEYDIVLEHNGGSSFKRNIINNDKIWLAIVVEF